MTTTMKWLLLISLTITIQAQDPRKKMFSTSIVEDNVDGIDISTQQDISCSLRSCKRSTNQDSFDPFWANRGKKDPSYVPDRFFVDEPHWVYIRADDNDIANNEPFFITRGKKDPEMKDVWRGSKNVRYLYKKAEEYIDSPFFAARGKKEARGINQ